MRETLDPRSSVVFNLLERPVEDLFLADTDAFARKVLVLDPSMTTVVVDEVQKIPRLLDAIHNLIETHKVPQRFVLTGSSARKLRAGAANLLGGRAAVRHLFPLTSFEIGAEFDIQSALSFGTLPQIWTTQDPAEKADLLRAYSSVYLKEEVWAEQLIRKLEPFRRFLEVAAQIEKLSIVEDPFESRSMLVRRRSSLRTSSCASWASSISSTGRSIEDLMWDLH